MPTEEIPLHQALTDMTDHTSEGYLLRQALDTLDNLQILTTSTPITLMMMMSLWTARVIEETSVLLPPLEPLLELLEVPQACSPTLAREIRAGTMAS